MFITMRFFADEIHESSLETDANSSITTNIIGKHQLINILQILNCENAI